MDEASQTATASHRLGWREAAMGRPEILGRAMSRLHFRRVTVASVTSRLVQP